MILIIFQAKLEELQSEKQNFVSQKEAADDGNRKLVSAECFCFVWFLTLHIIYTFIKTDMNNSFVFSYFVVLTA